MDSKAPAPKLFISYSHRDRRLHDRLRTYLAAVEQTADLETWSDERLDAGDGWELKIGQAISEAAIAVLLITQDFLASKFIQQTEVPRLIERHDKENLRLFPILARDCTWTLYSWLKGLTMRPDDDKPVWRSSGRYADRELKLITIEINGFVVAAKEAMERASQAKIEPYSGGSVLSEQEIDRERRAKEEAISKLSSSAFASMHAATNNDYQNALSIMTQAQSDAQVKAMQRWQVLQDAQTKIFDVMQRATLNSARSADKAYKRWDEYIRQA